MVAGKINNNTFRHKTKKQIKAPLGNDSGSSTGYNNGGTAPQK